MGRKRNRDVPAVATLTRQAPQKIAESVRLEFQDKPEHARKVAIYQSHRFSGLSLKEIEEHFGIRESAQSHRQVTGLNQPFRRMRSFEIR